MRAARATRWVVAGMAVLWLAPACGGSGKGAGANSLSGTVQGRSLDVQDALYATSESGAGTTAVIMVANQPSLCADSGIYRMRSGVVSLTLLLGTTAGTIDAGEYTVWTGVGERPERWALVRYSRRDASCQETLDSAHATAVSGTVTLATIAEGGVATGTFDVVIGEQADPLAGSFDADFCSVPADFRSHVPTCIWQGT